MRALGRILSIFGAVAALALVEPAAIAAPPRATDLVKVELVAEQAVPTPGSTLWLDLRLATAPGWHTYWRNPGDAGEPTTIGWTLPAGFSAGAIEWPIPERFAVDTITSYGYSGSTDLLVPVSVPRTPVASAQSLVADVKFLVCSNICIPGETTVTATLPVGAVGPPDPAIAARFAAARARLPQPAPFATSFMVEARGFRLIVPAAALTGLREPTAEFFPDDENMIDNSLATSTPRGGRLELVLGKSRSLAAAVPTTLSGVLVLRGSDGDERGYSIGATPAPAANHPGWWQAVALAFVGGLILNLMPCVFPILSLKLLGLAGAADSAARRHHGMAYAGGVLISFAALGGALLALRAGGAAIGWGFQLQSPVVVALLAYLMLALGLSLSGVAEVGTGFAGVGDRLAGRGGLLGAFFTGVLATVVATPCTAPFMAAALGAAVIAPAPVALFIFVALGAGLAAPMLLASFVPGVARVLPRPGAWMGVLKQVLAFPLYATVAWLIWVLTREVAPAGGFAALLGLVLTGFAVWVYGRSRFAAPAPRRLGGGLAAAGIAVAIVLAAMLTPFGPRAGAEAPAPLAVSDGIPYQQFSAVRLAALTAEHKPVFVNLTAAWCLTCLVNERVTLDRAAVRAAFASHGVVALKGDWTRQDPEIAAFLDSFGRSGVPLYLLYDGGGSPTVLPQILTESRVIDAVGKL
jgi:thiol:disulfide interchange protein/DsbC/DsbD-like thiol-disulfide interchange protein